MFSVFCVRLWACCVLYLDKSPAVLESAQAQDLQLVCCQVTVGNMTYTRCRGHVVCRMEVITPKEYVGTLMELCQGRRGEFIDMQFLTETRTTLIYELPLANVCSAAQPLSDLLVCVFVCRQPTCNLSTVVSCRKCEPPLFLPPDQ